jgi:hypothetical protein
VFFLPDRTASPIEQTSGAKVAAGFRGVRASKLRHVFGQLPKRQQCYENLRITTSAHDSQFVAVNPKFLAVSIEVAGGGAFQVNGNCIRSTL